MHTVLLTTDTAANAKSLAAFLSNLKTVKSVSIDPPIVEKHDWVSPSRPATEEEHEQMLKEAEESPIMLAEDAEAYSEELIKKWSKKK